MDGNESKWDYYAMGDSYELFYDKKGTGIHIPFGEWESAATLCEILSSSNSTHRFEPIHQSNGSDYGKPTQRP